MYAECVDIVTGMIPDAAPSSLYIPRALPTQLTTCPTNIWDAFIPPFLHADEICMRLLGMLDPEATEGVRPLLQPLREVVNSTLGVQVAMALAEGKDAGLPELGA